MTRYALACLALLGCQKKASDSPATPPPDLTHEVVPAKTPDAPKPPPPPETAVTEPLADATNRFAFDLWKHAPAGNVAMSPTSIALALAMTLPGAKGKTADQLEAALHLHDIAGLGALQQSLTDGSRGVTLKIANKLFGEQSFAFLPSFTSALQASFGAPLEPEDFKHAADAARVKINAWVAAQTNDKIKDLLAPKTLDAMTRLVLVNAIYFLGDWQDPFDSAFTRPETFTPLGAPAHEVPTMHDRVHVATAKANGGRLLALPYKGGATAMLIALPDAPDGITALEAKLDADGFAAWRKAMAMQEIDLSLPRFTVDPATAMELSKPLKALGVTDAFDDGAADFTGIGTPAEAGMRLYISAVYHKAFVKVDEKGTEAAGATAVVMAAGGGPPAPAEQVKVDHPFLFWIVDQKTGLVLFSGRVIDPVTK